jgi:hypothetical protein
MDFRLLEMLYLEKKFLVVGFQCEEPLSVCFSGFGILKMAQDNTSRVRFDLFVLPAFFSYLKTGLWFKHMQEPPIQSIL